MQKDSIKREQSQAGLSFAERKNFRPQVKNRLLLLLVLLLTAATGAWADETPIATILASENSTFVSGSKTFDDKVKITFSGAVDWVNNRWQVFYDSTNGNEGTVTVEGVNGTNISKVVFYDEYGSHVMTTSPYTMYFYQAPESSNFNVCTGANGEGETDLSVITKIEVFGTAPAATYTVTFAEGTDPNEWTASPATGVTKGTPVTVTYTGSKKVIGVKAEKKAAAKPLANATNEDLGKVVGADGNIYANKDAAEAVATGNAVAMICYVNEGHGLALALSDISSHYHSWDNSGTYNEGKTAAELCSAWNTSKAVTGATWKLASLSEMSLMINAAGNYVALRDGFSAVGGTNMIDEYYWLSDESSADYAKNFNFGDGFNSQEFKTDNQKVRACLEW